MLSDDERKMFEQVAQYDAKDAPEWIKLIVAAAAEFLRVLGKEYTMQIEKDGKTTSFSSDNERDACFNDLANASTLLDVIVKTIDENRPKTYDLRANSPLTAFLYENLTAIDKKRNIKTTENNRRLDDYKKELKYTPLKSGFEVTQTGSGITSVIRFGNAKSINGANVKKCFHFLLTELNRQYFQPVIRFNIDDLVSKGIYTQKTNAYRGFRTAFEAIKTISISGELKKGSKVISADSGVLFYHMKYRNGNVEISVNENITQEVYAPYFAPFPKWIYKLGDKAFTLTEYIFSLARTRANKIAGNGRFTLKYRMIQQRLFLPLSADDLKSGGKFKPKQYVQQPIRDTIEAINTESGLYTERQITLKPQEYESAKNLDEWLDKSTLEIEIQGDILLQLQNTATRNETVARKKIIAAKKRAAKNGNTADGK